MRHRSHWIFMFAFAATLARAQVSLETHPGRQLFETHCAFCHGPHGEGGKGPTLAQPSLPRASDRESLLKIIKEGINGTEMPRARLLPDQIETVADYVQALGRIEPERVRGDPARGEKLYAQKGNCAQCHTIHGYGGAIGPDLTQIGRRRSAAYLRRALVEPAADVPQSFNSFRSDVSLPENFVLVRVTTRDGQAASGVRVNEDTFSIQLRDLAGIVHSFLKSDLAELHKDWGTSPMPPFGGVFTADELDDLVAYLASLRGPPRKTDAEKPVEAGH
jgi:cytochrome c oxidase cbb3-type subunit III